MATCMHSDQYVQDVGTESFRAMVTYALRPRCSEKVAGQRSSLACYACSTVGAQHVFLCCHCTYVICGRCYSHRDVHAKKKGHYLWFDGITSQLWCHTCRDFVESTHLRNHIDLVTGQCRAMSKKIDSTVKRRPPLGTLLSKMKRPRCHDAISANLSSASRPHRVDGLGNHDSACNGIGNEICNGGSHNKSAEASPEDGGGSGCGRPGGSGGPTHCAKGGCMLATASQYSVLEKPHPYRGLRGMSNLGNTCFMNSVLQVLLHTPPLRNFFLSDAHATPLCPIKATCLACAVDRLFFESFCGKTIPYSPCHMLYSVWKNAGHLAGYSQQDAHEFLISLLNLLHIHINENVDVDDCDCIIHAAFEGLLQSDVTCSGCNAISSRTEPFFDVSLDFPPQGKFSEDVCDGGDDASEGVRTRGGSRKSSRLEDLFKWFTSPEALDDKETVKCEKCGQPRSCTKQISFKRLPPVLSVHIKRFERHSATSAAVKNDCHVTFPSRGFDLSPFCSPSIVGIRDGELWPASAVDPTVYDLVGVVNHHGTMDTGHYTAYVRLSGAPVFPTQGEGDIASGGTPPPRQDPDLDRGRWFLCNDSVIQTASLGEVLSSECYILMFVQRRFSYHALPQPST